MPAHAPKKALGQHFLKDRSYAERAVLAAGISPGETVLEIGPGPGVLTRLLSPLAKEVVAIELDRALAEDLEREALGNVRVVRGDAVKVDLPRFDACVSNLPYQISSPITFRLLAHPGWRVAVLMFQREFADRLVAAVDTRDYSRLTVMAHVRAQVSLVARVPPGAFSPPPKVESAIVKLVPRASPPFPLADEALFAGVVAAAFTQRRKTLSNALKNAAHLVSADVASVRAAAGSVPHAEKRAGAIAPSGFGEVADALARAGVAPLARGPPTD